MRRIVLLLLFTTKFSKSENSLRIVGGRDAEVDEFPYVVRLENQMTLFNPYEDTIIMMFTHLCTCTVLTPTWILTAGHCIMQNITQIRQIKRGAMKLTLIIRYGSVRGLPWQKGVYSKVIATFKHPAFKIYHSNKQPVKVNNDVGLIKTSPIQLKQYGKLSPVDYTTMTGHEVVLTGYGLTNYTNETILDTLALNKPLQVLKAVVKKCSVVTIAYPSICLAAPCNRFGSLCPGDSGGPVLHPSGVVAVNSLAAIMDCSPQTDTRKRSNIVGISTALSPFIGWIVNHIKRDSN